jgi:hypothetical protein
MFIEAQKLEFLLRQKMGDLKRNPHLIGTQTLCDNGDAHSGNCGAMVTANPDSSSLPTWSGSSNFDVSRNISRSVAQPLR